MFNTMINRKPEFLRDNMITKDLIMEENNYFADDHVTLERWARTNRQKILMNISFESQMYNIYDPKFTSQESDDRSLSSIERSVY